jgi:cation-transporting ATPase E
MAQKLKQPEPEMKIEIYGLTSGEVQERVEEGLVNGDQNIKTKSVGQILRTNILTFFNLLFLALAVLLFFFIPQNLNGYMQFGFIVLVVINIVIGVWQELRAKKTIDKLSLISAPKVTAVRDGEKTEIAVADIVMDDTMYLTAGCQICADSVVEEGSIEVNESLVTGEPDAIIKNVGDELLSGSFVVSGKAMAKVIRIGADNFATKISSGAKYIKKPTSEILRSLNIIVKFMAVVIVPLGILLFCMKYFVHTDVVYDPLKSANLVERMNLVKDDRVSGIIIKLIGSLIGMIPSGLVALTSTVFAISVIRLSTHKTLAQDLYCIETLARVDVLCLDKTGTITEGAMEVTQILPAPGVSDDEFRQILKNLTFAVDDDNATANAVKDFVRLLDPNAKATKIVPFSSARKWSGASFGKQSYILGAAEFVLKNISARQQKRIESYAEEGNRVLVLASTERTLNERALPQDVKFLGYVLITDKIRREAPETLRFFREQGVTIKIISGDNPVTVKAVAKRAGLQDADNYIDLSTLKTEQEVIEAAEKYTIFGRVQPEQKLILVKALKANGHTVAMTGDGVNDVLALKESDCSVAMASGSDAAKNVSSLVLLDSNFASMPRVVAEGRRSINNLERSAALFLVKTIYNFLLALIFSIIAEQLPYEPNDMTIIGAVTIGIPSFLLALEPNNDRIKGRFITKVMSNALPGALTVVIGILCIVIASRIYSFSTSDLNAMFFLMTSFASFVYLGKVCWKFNFTRATIFLFMLASYIWLFFMQFPNIDVPKTFGMPQYVSGEMAVAMGLSALFCMSFFINAVFVASKVAGKSGLIDKIAAKIESKEKEKKQEEALEEIAAVSRGKKGALQNGNVQKAETVKGKVESEEDELELYRRQLQKISVRPKRPAKAQPVQVVKAKIEQEEPQKPVKPVENKPAKDAVKSAENKSAKDAVKTPAKAAKTSEDKPVASNGGGTSAKIAKTAAAASKIE